MTNLLVIDDNKDLATNILRLAHVLGVHYTVRGVPGIAQLKKVLSLGERFDISLVDLGLGKVTDGNAYVETGLEAIDVLQGSHGAGGTVIVHTLTEDDSRLLLLYAIFHWYDNTVHGLLPKLGDVEGTTLKERATTFFESLDQIVDKRQEPDRSQPFRPTEEDDPFTELLGSWSDFRNLQLMIDSASLGDAAVRAGLRDTGLNNWGTEALQAADRLLNAANKASAITGIPVSQTVNANKGKPAAQLHAFASSQQRFLRDKIVNAHYDTLPTRRPSKRRPWTAQEQDKRASKQ